MKTNNPFRLFFLLLLGLFLVTDAQPLIGITSVYEKAEGGNPPKIWTNFTYVEAVRKAGGIPIVIPAGMDSAAVVKYVKTMDGLVLVGGEDIPPNAYGEKPHPTVKPLSPERFNFESRLIKQWVEKTKKPMLGICLGMQFTNVMSGGTLIQDIPSEVGPKVIHRTWRGAEHEIKVEKGTRLYKIVGAETLTVFSWHHQAVEKIGKGLVVSAKSPDGVVEAMEFSGKRFGIFTQFHPERRNADDTGRKIFKAFITACGKSR